MEETPNSEDQNPVKKEVQKEEVVEFKKPVLIGRVGKLPKKAKSEPEKTVQEKQTQEKLEKPKEPPSEQQNIKNNLSPAVLLRDIATPIPYKEPKWSGVCPDGTDYALEVLKSGVIVDRIELSKPYYVIGRLANCDVIMAHPTVSRHHAVLQYKAFAEEGEKPCGWYLYDLGSTHGTYLNKEKVKPSHYVRVRVGHQIKFGSSTRTYIVLGPDFDCEGESELSVTEIKKRALDMKLDRDRIIREAQEAREKEKEDEERRQEEQGIDWGMGEDAEEEPDLADNPYASTANEELYLTDPKKTLRGYCEREGHELRYDCEDRGVGQFLCRVELPMEDARGRPIVAEVIHRGKKKEAVIQCALEACRVLDRAGLLRQAKHESKRRKQRDWSADDYYDSDDDTFLDRTGSVEKKRAQRMRKHGAAHDETDKPRTYDDLVKEISEIESKISSEQQSLEQLRSNAEPTADDTGDELDNYMRALQKAPTQAHKADISRTKMNIQKLKAELSKTQRLAEIARPPHLPPLVKKDESKMAVKVANSIVYGKRIKLKEDMDRKPKIRKVTQQEESDFVEEMDSDDETREESPSIQSKSTQSTSIQSAVVKSECSNPELQSDSMKSTDIESDKSKKETEKKLYGPMRPPENYVIPENYFDQETDRDLPEIEEKDME